MEKEGHESRKKEKKKKERKKEKKKEDAVKCTDTRMSNSMT